MKEFIERYWTMIVGFFSSVSAKGINDISVSSKEAVQEVAQVTEVVSRFIIPPEEVLRYFVYGLVGALAGLLIRIVWGVLKRKFPLLNGIDR